MKVAEIVAFMAGFLFASSHQARLLRNDESKWFCILLLSL